MAESKAALVSNRSTCSSSPAPISPCSGFNRLLAESSARDRKSTRLNSSHTVIYTLSLHDALPISLLISLLRRARTEESGLLRDQRHDECAVRRNAWQSRRQR